ncbi:hypothetical protein K438DRAFT_1993077 [Mycena galopus ATCC 62051]|nr:hypothetical protein K438DRAFT_1993077 [Mycena galopus ATCC 62051]
MTDLMTGYVTRTRVGTPVPSAFPHHLEPDVQPDTKSGNTDNDIANAGVRNPQAWQGSFLEAAQATLAAATSLLPPGLASYLGACRRNSPNPPPPPPPNPLSRRSPLNHPYPPFLGKTPQSQTYSAHRSHGPLFVRDLAFDGVREDGVAPRRRFFSFYRIAATRAVSLVDAFRCSPPDVWLAFLHIPRPTSSLFSSHPGFSASASRAPSNLGPLLLAPGVASKPEHFHPAHHTNATYPPTHILHPYPTPHAVPQLSRDADASTSLGGDSGYAASTETEIGTRVEGVGRQGSAALNSSRLADNVPTDDLASSPSVSVQGSAALNSARLVDTMPTGDFAAPFVLSHVGGPGPGVGVQWSAALKSSRLADNVPTGDADLTLGMEADVDEPASEYGTADDTNTAGDSNGDGKEKKMENCKKSNLIQRFKEKMHRDVGSSSS